MRAMRRRYSLRLSRKKANGFEKLRPSSPSTKNWLTSRSRISTSWALSSTALSASAMERTLWRKASWARGW